MNDGVGGSPAPPTAPWRVRPGPAGLFLLAVALVLLASAGLSRPAAAALPVAAGGEALPSLAPMLERVTPAVVNISTRSRVPVPQNPLLSDPFFRRFFDLPEQPRERETQSLGSGVIVDARRGLIVTNNHVVQNAREITVILRDGRTLSAAMVGSDPDTDVAVIRVPPGGLAQMPLGDSDALRVGDFVVAIGNPFGLGQTVTSGIVSALGRSGLGIEGYEDFIQTDASINPGNSGGALVNLRGQLVGINTAILAPGGGNVGIGFAIPIKMVRDVMDQLVTYGKVRRGRLGVAARDLTPQLARSLGLAATAGAVVVRVVDGSAAAKAGLQAGDVVTAVDGTAVTGAGDMRNVIGLSHVGQTLHFTVLREGHELTLRAKLSNHRQESLDGARVNPRLAGATLSEIDEGSPLYGRIEGVLVERVDRSATAWRTGLRDGDVIVQVNRVPVRHLDELQALASQAGSKLLLSVRRGEQTVFLVVR